MVKNAIKEILLVFRAKLHSATGLTSSGVLFRHKYRGSYPNKKCTEFHSAIPKMIKEKKARCVESIQHVELANGFILKIKAVEVNCSHFISKNHKLSNPWKKWE